MLNMLPDPGHLLALPKENVTVVVLKQVPVPHELRVRTQCTGRARDPSPLPRFKQTAGTTGYFPKHKQQTRQVPHVSMRNLSSQVRVANPVQHEGSKFTPAVPREPTEEGNITAVY